MKLHLKVASAVLAFFFIVINYKILTSSFITPRSSHVSKSSVTYDDSVKTIYTHDKWIIITSISPPTEDVKFLAKIPGWQLLVVGDKKTPSNWNHPNTIYLSVYEQDLLGFRTTRLLPFGSYTRKNVGYLYAIAHGARVIYETDDDNRPLDGLNSFILTNTTPGLIFAGSKLFNPYLHFGQSTLWPRGFPLSAVGVTQDSIYRVGRNWSTPLIQQGLVNGDPDMDAIFRLTRKNSASRLDVKFDPAAPPVLLPAGVFSPFNSQNTLFHYDAFPILLLPTTTTFRMCDIWRGYWAQRLVWEIGGHLSFFPPNAYQLRNSHSYMADAEDEKTMYYDTDRLLVFLGKWTCPQEYNFYECMHTLSIDMAEAQFWNNADVDIVLAWIQDLKRVGYKEPKRILFNNEFSLVERQPSALQHGRFVNFIAREQTPPAVYINDGEEDQHNSHISQIIDFCSSVKNVSLPPADTISNTKHKVHSDILLVITFNFPNWYSQAIPYLEMMHRHFFPNIVYCGDNQNEFLNATATLKKNLSFIEAPMVRGELGYRCLPLAMDMGYNVSGFLVISDDIILNTLRIQNYDKTKFWIDEHGQYFNCTAGINSWKWWNLNDKMAYRQVLSVFESIAKDSILTKYFHTLHINGEHGVDSCLFRSSDIVYVPKSVKKEVTYLLNLFLKHNVFLEIAVPMALYGVMDKRDILLFKSVCLWGEERSDPWKYFLPEKIFLHPVKFSNPSNRKPFCEKYLIDFY